jgi:hypothetical protein
MAGKADVLPAFFCAFGSSIWTGRGEGASPSGSLGGASLIRRFVHYGIVAVLAAYALAGIYSAASDLWQTRGWLGIVSDYGTVVRAVEPGSPAARAGIVAGDEIDLAVTPFDVRRFLVGVAARGPAGETITFNVRHDGASRPVTLVAAPHRISGPDRGTLFIQCFAAVIFVIVGAGLILVRPSPPTWGFGVYCLVTLPTANYPFHFGSAGLALAAICAYDVLQNLGTVGLLVFALSFPRPLDGRARAFLQRSLPVVFVAFSAMTLYPDIATLVLGRGARIENGVLQAAFGVADIVAVSILWDSYRRIDPQERERVSWVLAGFGIGLLASDIGNTILFSSLIPIDPPTWLLNVLGTLNVLLPVAVAYAVVRHRVLDINVAAGFALVYGILTFVLGGTFSLFDWLFGHVLEDFRLSLAASAVVSMAFAIAFNALHHLVEGFVEKIFFRKRREIEARLTRLIDEIPEAADVAAVERALVDDTANALDLSSAALFLKDGSGDYRRTAAAGWDDAERMTLSPTDEIVRRLHARRDPLALTGTSLALATFPAGPAAPVIAFPLPSRGELAGVIIYGEIRSGRPFDAAEIALLERLARAAGLALDVLGAELLRHENAVQAATIEQLRRELDEPRRAPPARR